MLLDGCNTGYSRIFDGRSLAEQLAGYEVGEGQNTEHYRYKWFLHLLEEAHFLDDATVDGYVELADWQQKIQTGKWDWPLCCYAQPELVSGRDNLNV